MEKQTAYIHPTAIIETGACLGNNVHIGAYAYIGAEVSLAEGCMIHHHASVDGLCTMGAHNEVFPYACIGGKTHDLKYKGGNPGLKIGNHNVFREYVTVHAATHEGDWTLLGSHNVILAYSHIAHDCQIGDRLVMSSHAALGGHAVVGNHVNIGWGAGVHQFCHLGDYSMLGASSKLVQDVLPFMIADGNPAEVRSINRVGLQRKGFSEEAIEHIKNLYKIFYRSGLNRSQALTALKERYPTPLPEVQKILDFIEASSRGLA